MKPKEKKRRINLLNILLVLMLCLSGCGPKESTETQPVTPDGEVKPVREYITSFQEFMLPANITGYCNILQVTEDAFYFSDSSHSYHDFYKVSFEDEKMIPVRLPMAISEGEVFLEFYVTGNGEYILCHSEEETEQFYLSLYDKDGVLVWSKEITDNLSAEDRENGGMISAISQDVQGNIYLKGTHNVVVFSQDGEGKGTFDINMPYIAHLVCSGSGRVYAISGEDMTVYPPQCTIVELDGEKMLLGKQGSIPGGTFQPGPTGGIAYFEMAEGMFKEYYPEENSSRDILACAQYDIANHGIQGYCVDEKTMHFIFWELQDNSRPFEIMTLTKADNPTEIPAEKEEITLLSVNHSSDLLYKVQSFNRKNEKYRIRVEYLNKGNIFSGEELVTKLNTQMLSGDVDMVLLNQQDYLRYKEQKVFEDIRPYLAGAQIKLEEYNEELVKPFMNGEELYALPTQFTLYGYAVKSSTAEGNSMKTMEDFLAYLEQNPDSKLRWGGGKFWALETCMKFGWERFVDVEADKCYFDQNEFKEIVKRINNLELDLMSYDRDWEELALNGETLIPELQIYQLKQLASEEVFYGGDLIWMGYPGEGESSKTYAFVDSLLCILANSDKKEQAFAFWEYYVQSKSDDAGKLSTKTSILEQQIEGAGQKDYYVNEAGEQVERAVGYVNYTTINERTPYYALNEKQTKMIKQALDSMEVDSLEGTIILEIIIEELTGYLNGAQDLDAACDVIQNRVQLYLDEN